MTIEGESVSRSEKVADYSVLTQFAPQPVKLLNCQREIIESFRIIGNVLFTQQDSSLIPTIFVEYYDSFRTICYSQNLSTHSY